MATGQTVTASPSTPVSLQTSTLSFVEAGAATYTGKIKLPADAILVDLIVVADALWTAATSASLIIGDADDDDGYIAATNLKATDLLANESLSIGSTQTLGGVPGAYLTVGTSTHTTHRSAAEIGAGATAGAGDGIIIAKVTSVGAGTAGRTRVIAVFSVGAGSRVTAV
jgi:hypothetical protein